MMPNEIKASSTVVPSPEEVSPTPCDTCSYPAHQIRVHLQYLGHPIANDPLYGGESIWGESLGRGGVDLIPTANALSSEEVLARRVKSGKGDNTELAEKCANSDLSDRAYANIDASSPIRLSQQAREIIAKLRKARDEAEDWIKRVAFPLRMRADDRWKEVVFTTQNAQDEITVRPVPTASEFARSSTPSGSSTPVPPPAKLPRGVSPRSLISQEADQALDDYSSPLPKPDFLPEGFCDQCYVPVPDDPDPEGLFIYLHALRYTTPKLGEWSTPLPRWAESRWGGDWRGWSDEAPPEPFPDEAEDTGSAIVESQAQQVAEAQGETGEDVTAKE